MNTNWDQVIDRRDTDSVKWRLYGAGVLPLWVADMDFAAPEPVLRALRERVEHGVFGYPVEPTELRPLILERLKRLYAWDVEPDALVFVPGVVAGFNLAIRACTHPGDGVLVQPPVYYPILWAPPNAGCGLVESQLAALPEGDYGVDLQAMEAAITDRTRIFVLCNPHNPVGRVFRRDELEAMAQVCLRHGLVICSDEIHNDLLFDGHRHLPIASLDRDIAERTITLIAPSKTFNIAGLHSSVAIIHDPDLRRRFRHAGAGIVPFHLDVLGSTAAVAAYRDGQPWLDDLLRYLAGNRAFLKEFVDTRLAGTSLRSPEGTYLAWLDCRGAGLPENAHKFFLEKARVAVNDGASFGRGGEGFVRLNFACPRSTLTEALERMETALAAR